MPETLHKKCCWSVIYSFDIVTGCKLISFIQIVRFLIALIMTIMYYKNQGFSLVTVHSFCVAIIFLITGLFTVEVLMMFYRKSNQWWSLMKFYKALFVCALTWLIEYCVFIGLTIGLKSNPLDLLILAFPTLFCIIQDFYFSYCIYYCKNLAETGRLFQITQRQIASDATFGLVVRNQSLSHGIGVPIDKSLPIEADVMIVHDFTQVSPDKINESNLNITTIHIENEIEAEIPTENKESEFENHNTLTSAFAKVKTQDRDEYCTIP